MKVGTSCSCKSNVISGIPQGSILVPILFVIYLNDLPNFLASQCKMFADSVEIYDKPFNHDIDKMDMNNIVEWSTDWCLYFSTKKCNVLHSGEKNTNCNFFMSVVEVDYKLNIGLIEKDLGVTFDAKLNFDRHAYEITHKATKILCMLK